MRSRVPVTRISRVARGVVTTSPSRKCSTSRVRWRTYRTIPSGTSFVQICVWCSRGQNRSANVSCTAACMTTFAWPSFIAFQRLGHHCGLVPRRRVVLVPVGRLKHHCHHRPPTRHNRQHVTIPMCHGWLLIGLRTIVSIGHPTSRYTCPTFPARLPSSSGPSGTEGRLAKSPGALSSSGRRCGFRGAHRSTFPLRPPRRPARGRLPTAFVPSGLGIRTPGASHRPLPPNLYCRVDILDLRVLLARRALAYRLAKQDPG